MSPYEWTSQRNWRRTTALSQKDAFEFPSQVVLILVGLLPTSTNTLSVGTWLPRITKVPMRKTNVITWPPFTRCAICIAKKVLFMKSLHFIFSHQNHFVGVLGISLNSTLVWSVVSSSVHQQYWWRWNLWQTRKLLFRVSRHLQERGSHTIFIGYLTANKLLICKFCCESGSGPLFVQILAP